MTYPASMDLVFPCDSGPGESRGSALSNRLIRRDSWGRSRRTIPRRLAVTTATRSEDPSRNVLTVPTVPSTTPAKPGASIISFHSDSSGRAMAAPMAAPMPASARGSAKPPCAGPVQPQAARSTHATRPMATACEWRSPRSSTQTIPKSRAARHPSITGTTTPAVGRAWERRRWRPRAGSRPRRWRRPPRRFRSTACWTR